MTKTIRSQSAQRNRPSEKLYVIKGISYNGTPIYTKGRFGKEADREVFYVLISAKIAT